MGYVFNFNDAKKYKKFYNDPDNLSAIDMEIKLMLSMLKPAKLETILDIGCGTGDIAFRLVEQGLLTTGIDPSPHMLDYAEKKLGEKVDLHKGFAEKLPFGDNFFNYSSIVTALEFVENPEKAIREACRVTKDKVFIGVLNSYAITGIRRRIKGMFFESIYNKARFFNVWELKNLVRQAAGDVPITWRTVSLSPSFCKGNRIEWFEKAAIERSPFGAFIGMTVIPIPRFRVRPIKLKCVFNGAPAG